MVQRAALIVVLALSACKLTSDGQPGNPYLPLSALQAEPASRVVMPGTELIRRVGGERFDNVTGPEPSFTGADYGAQVAREDVFVFYDHELSRLGWLRDSDPILVSGESVTRGWCKPNMRFRLAIYDPRRYDRVGIEGGERFTTVFRAAVIAARGSCPNVAPPMPTP